MSDPRYPQQRPTSSNRNAPTLPPQNHHETDDLTWLDFLRTAGGTLPPPPPPPPLPPSPSREDSADRKRRHTGVSPERRNYPYSPYMSGVGRRLSAGMSVPQASGISRETAVDLTTTTTSPPRARPSMPTRPSGAASVGSGGSRRRSSDVVLPRWQPDSEVSRCPVCKTEFSFWYRKHHCRKCGRVVCAACSPHRITIPKQYIVQPPNPFETEFVAHAPESPRLTGNPALGGGEVVRVCNPCVPDPWTPDTASGNGQQAHEVTVRPLQEAARNTGNRSDLSGRYRSVPPPPTGPGAGGSAGARGRVSSHQSISTMSRSVPHGLPITPVYAYGRPPPPPTSQSRPYSHRQTQSANSPFPPIPPFNQRPPITTAPSAPPQPKLKREVNEEDECPVCGTELPPGEQLRQAHIQECIAARFSSTPSTSTPIPPPPAAPPATISGPLPSSDDAATASASTPPAAPSQLRATSYRPRGMALYRATEKDCTNEDGEAQECVICFEEFQPGDEMGRMECLCKFHRGCIRRWWDTKGVGSCPTHQLHH